MVWGRGYGEVAGASEVPCRLAWPLDAKVAARYSASSADEVVAPPDRTIWWQILRAGRERCVVFGCAVEREQQVRQAISDSNDLACDVAWPCDTLAAKDERANNGCGWVY